jgi:hypothetical protein
MHYNKKQTGLLLARVSSAIDAGLVTIQDKYVKFHYNSEIGMYQCSASTDRIIRLVWTHLILKDMWSRHSTYLLNEQQVNDTGMNSSNKTLL